MRRIAVLLMAIWPGFVAAQSWEQIVGDDILAVLSGAEVRYIGARQTFDADGATFYEDGRPSYGRWRVLGDQYCSQWPPSDLWSCYDVTVNGTGIRFIASDQSVTEGTLHK
jgi:hypothetical protein